MIILLVGLLIGLALGLTGAGGSLLAVPLLVLALGQTPAEAMGLSLVAVLLAALAGVIKNWRRSQVLWWPSLVLAGSGFITAPLGRWLAGYLPVALLLVGFSLLALLVALKLWRSANLTPRAAEVALNPEQAYLCNISPSGSFQWRLPCIAGLIWGGLAIGLLSGLFGVGGGFLIVPLLLALSGIAMPLAVASSLVVIAAVSSAGVAANLLLLDDLDSALLLWLGVGSIAGMLLATPLASRLQGARLQKLFSLLVLLSALAMGLRQFNIY